MLKERLSKGDFLRKMHFVPDYPIKYLNLFDIVANLNDLDASKDEFYEALPLIEKNMQAVTRVVIYMAKIFNNTPSHYKNLRFKSNDLVSRSCDICKMVEKKIIEEKIKLTDKELANLFIPIMNDLENLVYLSSMPG